jgi:hypothetical protein
MAQLDWYDRRTGEPMEVNTPTDRKDPERFASAMATGALLIQNLGFVLGRYGRRAEHKSLAPDGGPGDREAGLLERRAVESSPALTDITGKEGNKLAERLSGTELSPADYRNDYGPRANMWDQLVRPILTELGASHLIQNTGFGPTAVYDVLRGATPHPDNRTRYERTAVEYATKRLGVVRARAARPQGTPLALPRRESPPRRRQYDAANGAERRCQRPSELTRGTTPTLAGKRHSGREPIISARTAASAVGFLASRNGQGHDRKPTTAPDPVRAP